MPLPNGMYLVKPGVSFSEGEISKSELESYCDYTAEIDTEISHLKYLYVNCVDFETSEDKKVKITRFVNRGIVGIDLNEMFTSVTFKDVYLGKKILNSPASDTRIIYRIMAYRYAWAYWNKISNGKTSIIRIYNYNSNPSEEKYYYVQDPEFTVYKNGTAYVATYMFGNGQLKIDTDSFGNVLIKAFTLEEKL